MGEHPLADWLEADTSDQQTEDQRTDHGRDPGDAGARRRRVLRLAGLAVVPWIAVALVFAFLRGGSEDAAEADTSSDAALPTGPDHPVGATTPSPHVDETDRADPSKSVPASVPLGAAPGPTTAHVPAAAAAAASTGVRLHMSSVEQAQSEAVYVDHVAAEGLDQVGDMVVVRVLAVVLEGDGSGWRRTVLRRFAAPLSRADDGGYVLAGAPWPLPDPPQSLEAEDMSAWQARDWQARDTPAEGTSAALEAAGFADVQDVEAFEDPETGIHRVSFEASRPAGRHEVWLAVDPLPRVLGAPAPRH